MSSLSEDEVLDTLTWSDESYTLAEFINEHTLPQVVQVVRGYDGGTDSLTIGYGEILTLHALRETPKLTAEDSNSNAMSIAFDCPYKFNVLPQTKDCSFNRCGVENLLSCYPKVKYLEVLQAHYSTGAGGEESTSVGELLEILSIDKRQRKLKVKNIESEQTFMLPTTCTAAFRPLLDWRSYCAKDFKTQFDFPTRVRFLVDTDTNGADGDEKCRKLLSKTPDVNVVGEIEEVLVITTTVGSCPDLKFCYEIPSDLEIKVAVTDGFSSGDRHYQEVVTNLDKGFDVPKFMSTQQPAFLKYRESITQYDYACLPDLFLNLSKEVSNTSGKSQEEAPALPPRRTLSESKSVPLYVTSPIIAAKPAAQLPKASLTSTNDNSNPKPAVLPPLPKKKGPPPNIPQRTASNLTRTPNDHPNPQSTPTPPSPKLGSKSFDGIPTNVHPNIPSAPPPPSPKPSSKRLSGIDSTSIPSVPSKLPPDEPNTDLPAVSQTEEAKPTPSEPAVILARPIPPRRSKVSEAASKVKPPVSEPETAIDESGQAPVTSPRVPLRTPKVVTGWALPGLNKKIDQSTHPNEPPMTSPKLLAHSQNEPQAVSPEPPDVPPPQSNNPDESPRVPLVSPLDKPPLRPRRKSDGVLPAVTPKLSPIPRRIPTDPTTAKQVHGGETVLKEPDAKLNDSTSAETTQSFESKPPPEEVFKEPSKDDDDYEELEPIPLFPLANIAAETTTTSAGPKQTEIRPHDQSDTWTVLTGSSPGTGWETEDPYAAVARIPQDLSGLSVSEVSQLLKHLRMECYAERFAEEMIDGKLLKSLQDDELQSLNVSSFHCKKLVKFINGWRPVQ